MNFEVLQTELVLAKYSAMTDAEAATDLNNTVISVKQPIATHDVKAYLLISGKWNAIKKSTDVNAEDFVDVINSMESVDFNLAGVEARVIAILDALVATTAPKLMTATDKAYILSLADKTVSRADQLGLPLVTPYFVNLARGV